MATTSPSPSVLSQTLKSITLTKIEELTKQRDAYSTEKARILDSADPGKHDIRPRILSLLDGVKELDLGSAERLGNIKRWVTQSKHDVSVTQFKLVEFETELRDLLHLQSRKLDLAHLYSRLLIEWIENPNDQAEKGAGEASPEGDFDVVESIQKERFQQLKENFAAVVFEPLETDEEKINEYLTSLFDGDYGEEILENVRSDLGRITKEKFYMKKPIYLRQLKRCIDSLLKNRLLDDEKAATLREFSKDDTVLEEIRDVLNMRYESLNSWSWDLGTGGVPVRTRQSLNGTCRAVMDEDVLQALLTHWIGHALAARLHEVLEERVMMGMTRPPAVPKDEEAKRNYFLEDEDKPGKEELFNSIDQLRYSEFSDVFMLAPLPTMEFDDQWDYDNDKEGEEPAGRNAYDPKQRLLRTLTSELLVNQSLNGEAAIVQSDFKWFGTGMAHSTVFACLRFIGFAEEWIDFFKKALAPPLDMLDGTPVRERKRGLPMAHIFSKFLGELVLFFMDVAVLQRADTLPYRFHDDLWLCGEPKKCAEAWSEMQEFASIMGLEFNRKKTGSAYLVDKEAGKKRKSEVEKVLPEGEVVFDFLVLDPNSGQWTINKDHVDKHAMQLRKQLGQSKSILSWVKTWNSCIGRFFGSTFGGPANCLGRPHLDAVLQAHEEIQKSLFGEEGSGSQTVTDYLRNQITKRFGRTDVPDAFLFLPDRFGGLGLLNPFVTLSLVSDDICPDPVARMRQYHIDEAEGYELKKKNFEALSEQDRRRRFRRLLQDDDPSVTPLLAWEKAQEFFSYEEYTKLRGLTSVELGKAYQQLLSAAPTKGLEISPKVEKAMKESGPIRSLTPETKWMLQLYSDELFEKYGGLSLVDRSLLPLALIKAMNTRRVTWRMVL